MRVHAYLSGNLQVADKVIDQDYHLPQPKECPDEFYALMLLYVLAIVPDISIKDLILWSLANKISFLSCWKKSAAERPTLKVRRESVQIIAYS